MRDHRANVMQEPITRSIQLPYSACETGFSQVELFSDIKPLSREYLHNDQISTSF